MKRRLGSEFQPLVAKTMGADLDVEASKGCIGCAVVPALLGLAAALGTTTAEFPFGRDPSRLEKGVTTLGFIVLGATVWWLAIFVKKRRDEACFKAPADDEP